MDENPGRAISDHDGARLAGHCVRTRPPAARQDSRQHRVSTPKVEADEPRPACVCCEHRTGRAARGRAAQSRPGSCAERFGCGVDLRERAVGAVVDPDTLVGDGDGRRVLADVDHLRDGVCARIDAYESVRAHDEAGSGRRVTALANDDREERRERQQGDDEHGFGAVGRSFAARASPRLRPRAPSRSCGGAAGSLAIAFRSTGSSSVGSRGLRSLALGGSSSRCAQATARRESRTNGASPVRHSYSRQPSE